MKKKASFAALAASGDTPASSDAVMELAVEQVEASDHEEDEVDIDAFPGGSVVVAAKAAPPIAPRRRGAPAQRKSPAVAAAATEPQAAAAVAVELTAPSAGAADQHQSSEEACASPPPPPKVEQSGAAADVGASSSPPPEAKQATVAAVADAILSSPREAKQATAAAVADASPSSPREAKQATAAAVVGAGASSPAAPGSGAVKLAELSAATVGVRLTLFERAAVINARKAAFRAQVPDGCTFAPAINARRAEASSFSPVGARLHALATAKQHAATLRVLGGAGQEVCSFSPVLLTRRPKPVVSAAAQAAAVTAAVDVAAALRSKKAAAVAAASDAAKAAAHPTLTAKAAALVRRGSVGERLYGLAAVQRHVAAQPPPVPAECTFSPRVNAGVPPAVKARFAQAGAAGRAEGKAPSPPSAGAAAAAESPHERLYRSSALRETARIALAAEVNASAMRECTFSPRLGSGGSRAGGRLYASKEELLGARTGAVAASGTGPVNAGSRLHSAAMERAARHVASVAQAAAAVDPEATFSPALSPTSRRIVANIREEEGGQEGDVGARLYEGGRAAVAARAVAAAAPTAGLTGDTVRELTFQPRINANAYREEDGVPVHERLYRLGRRASGGGEEE